MANQTVNGVPVAACLNLVDAVKNNPEAGKTQWRSVTTWNGGFDCQSEIRQHTLSMNEPEALGGTDTAPNMVESVLAAYGSCLTVGYTLNAALRGITINNLRVEVEGDLNLAGFFGLSEDVPPGFTHIRAVVHLDADATRDELETLHAHTLKTSPVGSILTQPLRVATELAPTSVAA